MSVIVRPITIAGGRSLSSSFTDSMNRASGPLGSNWVAGQEVVNPAPYVALPHVAIAASSVDGSQVMKVSTNNAAVGTTQPLVVIPLQPLGLLNRSQFCQWTVKRHLRTAGANTLFAGPVVMCTATSQGSDSNAYIWQCATPGANSALIRRNGTAQTGFDPPNPAIADGDVLRLVATINAADVTLQIFRNGTLQQTVVDAAAGRLTTGLPGFMATSMNEPSGNYISEWFNFSCGPA